MQFPESWLRAFCNPPLDTQALADTLTMAGLEVEELRPVAPAFRKIVVGRILQAEQHPNADRLRVCQVDAGQDAPLSIVCGAPNARAGILVPCALVGAELPPGDDGKPFLIKVGKLRGVESQGMLCSARELRIGEDTGGLLELSAEAPVGADIREWLNLDDTLFTLKLTPNLAHCLSVYGVARELAALTGAPLRQPEFPPVPTMHDQRLPVQVSAPDLCGRFAGRIVRNVDPRATTPSWMVERLARCGQRAVAPLVDISNYVMFELGRPSHMFDLDRIEAPLEVRWAREGERLELLNGNTVALDPQVGVIADARQVESLAGIMGGEASSIADGTTNIYIEAAFWHPSAIAGRSRRFNFSTDAGHRFERGVDPGHLVEHLERITALVLEICGGEAGPVDDIRVSVPASAPVRLRVARASKVIGMPLTEARCRDALAGLGLDVAQDGDGVLVVTPPSYRFDIALEEDLIEEVARVVGYENLPTTPPLAPITAKLQPESRRGVHALRRQVAGLGYQETINFSFVEERWERELAGNPAPIRLLNPIASQMNVMRSSLMGSLLQVLKFNLDRKAERVRVFEIGRVFWRDDAVQDSDTTVQGYRQPMRLAGLAAGRTDALQWDGRRQAVDFYDAKGDIEALLAPLQPRFEAAEHPALHPGRSARILLDGRPIGFVGELHPRWRQGYGLAAAQVPVLFELELDAVLQRRVPVAQPVDRQQDIERDIAVIVADGVGHAQVQDAILAGQAEGGLVRSVTLFDVYRPVADASKDGGSSWLGAGEKSLALRLRINGGAAAPTEAQIDAAVQHAVEALKTRVGARMRA